MTENPASVHPPVASLSPQEELHLQQLQQMKLWLQRSGKGDLDSANGGTSPIRDLSLPRTWEMTRGVTLHDWQHQCIDAWFANNKSGVIKVVTGAGKTMLALGIVEALQSQDSLLRVAIVVPTLVLMYQWLDEIRSRSNLPPTSIGLMGGGHSDAFNDSVRVLICVLNSAAKKLHLEVAEAKVAEHLLLVVDECHRAAALEMRRVFKTQRAYSLGLSATPERDDENDSDEAGLDVDSNSIEGSSSPAFVDTVVGRELGTIVFELTYAEAISRNVLPHFTMKHYGLSLQSSERHKYDELSREIKDLKSELEISGRRGLALVMWCRRVADRNPKAARLVHLTAERKRLLYRMQQRVAAVLQIVKTAFEERPETKVILFHESIAEVMSLFFALRAAGYPVVAEHSEFPDQVRSESIRLFRKDIARIIVSARSLIEGFNVPSADLGIIVAASSSVRQRVQTLGRLLRKGNREQGIEKAATMFVLYADNTVDELIYEKADWNKIVGSDRNEFFLWKSVEDSEPLSCPLPPRAPKDGELAIEESKLSIGAEYPGNLDEGRLFSRDTQGTIRDERGRLIQPHSQLQSVLKNSKKKAGRFRITPARQFVFELEKIGTNWRGVYLGKLSGHIVIAQADESDNRKLYSPGDEYPLGRARGTAFSVLQRDSRLIAKKNRGNVKFIVQPERLSDDRKREQTLQIIGHLRALHSKGRQISKIIVTETGDVVSVVDNQALYIGSAPEGADGFLFED